MVFSRTQPWEPSLRTVPQNSQALDVPPDSGAPQLGQWADEMLLPASVWELARLARMNSSLDQKSWPVDRTRPFGSATKRLPDQRISTATRSHSPSPVTISVCTDPTAQSAMNERSWPGVRRRL